MMAGGTMRGDQVYPAGILRLGDIIECFPFEDPCVVIRVSGSAILAALENSVSKLPALEGRFCQVSGLEFGYDPTRPSGDRVRWVNVAGDKLRMDRRYTVATRGYMAHGKDGFESLNIKNEDVEDIIDEEHGVLISVIIRQYFLSLKVISTWRRAACISSLFKSLHKRQADSGMLSPNNTSHPKDLERRSETSDEEDEVTEAACTSPVKERLSAQEELKLSELKRRVAQKWEILAKVDWSMRGNKGDAGVNWCRSVRPRVEGRIKIVAS
jgi:5'-nucleotidase